MFFDYEKAKAAFLAELDAGKYSGKLFPNSGSDYQEREEDDIAVFNNYINSDIFKSIDAEVSQQ